MMVGNGFIGQPLLANGNGILVAGRRAISVPAETCSIKTVHCCSDTSSGRYPYFIPITPAVEECLLVPFYIGGKAVGTIWAITHGDRRRFDGTIRLPRVPNR